MSFRFIAVISLSSILLTACGGSAPPPSIATPSLASSSEIADAERFESI